MSRRLSGCFDDAFSKNILSFTEQYLRDAVPGWPSPCSRAILDGADGERTEKDAAAPCLKNLPNVATMDTQSAVPHGRAQRVHCRPGVLARGSRLRRQGTPRACDRRHRRVSKSIRAQRRGNLLVLRPSFWCPSCLTSTHRSITSPTLHSVV